MATAGLFLLAVAGGWLWVEWARPIANWRPRWAGWLLHAALAIGVGLGATSMAYFLALWLGARSAIPAVVFDVVFTAAGAYLARKRRAAREEAVRRFRYNWALAAALGVAWALVAGATWDSARTTPYGDWDAWSMWNVRAAYLAGEGAAWRNAVSPEAYRGHPDYPLLVPAAAARLWRVAGKADPGVPRALGLLFTLSAMLVVVGTAALSRSPSAGLLAGLILTSSAGYFAQAPAQYADIPLSFYMAAAVGLLMLTESAEEGRLMALAGFLASCAAWTKNEGLVFALVFLGSIGLFLRRELWPALAGAAPGLALVASFRLLAAPASEYARQPPAAIIEKLVAADRWWAVISGAVRELLNWGLGVAHPLLLMGILAAGLRFRREWFRSPHGRAAALALSLTVLAYAAVLVISPHDLAWQIGTAMNRLIAQVWPAGVLLLFAGLRTLEESLPPPDVPAPARAKERRRKKGR